ncbi:hypothetical protein [Streptomyces sp. NPDC093094]|uniref:hypothetical protein n=1 Tax=Streptomyces sp. NPDC093094 TaxID=3366026 RepID=UPI003801FA94
MTEHPPPTDAGLSDAPRDPRHALRLAYGLGAVKVIFMLALFRMLAAPFTKDFFGEALLPMPTWEWSLCSLSPLALLYAARRRADWAMLAGERFFLKIILTFYLLWALPFAVLQGEWVLWIAVAVALAGFAGMYRLNRRETVPAR